MAETTQQVQVRCPACNKRLADIAAGDSLPRIKCPRCGRRTGA